MTHEELLSFIVHFTKKPVRFAELYPMQHVALINATDFLPTACPIKQRFWHIVNNIDVIPTCAACNLHPCNWNTNTKAYTTYCSNHKCSGSDHNRNTKMKNTMLLKYGVDSFAKTEQYKNQMKSVRTPEKSTIAAIKRKITLIEKHGSEENWKKDVGTKSHNHYQQLSATERGQLEIKQHNGMLAKYGVKYAMQSPTVKAKHQATNIEKYGNTSFTRSQIPADILKKLYNPEWLTEQHHQLKKTQQQIAIDLNVNPTTVGKIFDDLGIEKKYFYGSAEQTAIADWLIQNGITVQQNVKMLGNKEIDIYLPDLNIAIEYCGIYWHCDIHDRITKNTHADKFNQCKNLNIQLITIFQNEWIHTKELVKKKLLHICGINDEESVHARKCICAVMPTKDKGKFHSSNHIQGNDKSKFAVALYHNNKPVACLSGKFNNDQFEITRFSTSMKVQGGFSKLLKFVETETKCKSFITFADLRWSTGKLYQNTGFVCSKHLPPTFYYYDNKTKKLNHRSNYMKHKIIAKHNLNPTMTEFQMCDQLQLLRIWDCGKLKFEKTILQ